MIISSPEIIFILKVTCKATVASAAGMKQDSLGFEQYRGGGILDSDLRTIQGIYLLSFSKISVDKCSWTPGMETISFQLQDYSVQLKCFSIRLK